MRSAEQFGQHGNAVLTLSLRELGEAGVVHREDYREVPPRVAYSLTPFGASLLAAMVPLGERSMAVLEGMRRDR